MTRSIPGETITLEVWLNPLYIVLARTHAANIRVSEIM